MKEKLLLPYLFLMQNNSEQSSSMPCTRPTVLMLCSYNLCCAALLSKKKTQKNTRDTTYH